MNPQGGDGLTLRICPAMAPEEARLLHPLQLAYLGDTVWDMLTRTELLGKGLKLTHMHREAVASVNAAAQAAALGRISGALTEPEADIVRRGRNAHAHHPAPRHQDPADYVAATGLEALMGYLLLTGEEERAQSLFLLSRHENGGKEHA